MKTSFNMDTNICLGWYKNQPFKVFHASLFDVIKKEIFVITVQLFKFVFSVSISLY